MQPVQTANAQSNGQQQRAVTVYTFHEPNMLSCCLSRAQIVVNKLIFNDLKFKVQTTM